MLEAILGSKNCERVLTFIFARDEGYATDITRFFETDIYGIQKQLDMLELGGVLVSRKVGGTRPYSFNPSYPFLSELENLLGKTLSFYPEEIKDGLPMNRRKPRHRLKPT